MFPNLMTMFKRSAKPTTEQVAMVKELYLFGQELKQHRLNLLCYPNSAVLLLVEFFNSTSPRQDMDLASKLTELNGGVLFREDLRALGVHLRQTGRADCRMNRTEFGQRVHDANVFLGGVDYMPTRNVAEILAEGDETDFYRVVNRQATTYLISHLDPMIRLINSLLKSPVVDEILNN